MQMWVWSLGRDDPLEKEMAAHSSIFVVVVVVGLQYFCLGNPRGRGAW